MQTLFLSSILKGSRRCWKYLVIFLMLHAFVISKVAKRGDAFAFRGSLDSPGKAPFGKLQGSCTRRNRQLQLAKRRVRLLHFLCPVSLTASGKSTVSLNEGRTASTYPCSDVDGAKSSRRTFLSLATATLAVSTLKSLAAASSLVDDNCKPFRSGGYGREEYSNAFTASRDTNISPKEAYDTISTKYIAMDPIQAANKQNRTARALDMGAGAGVSTQVLWDMGYRSIDAVDWSSDAWDRFVVEDPQGHCPPSVRFLALDDERYRLLWRKERKERRPSDDADAGSDHSNNQNVVSFDAIVFNFAVNESKAKAFASEMLTSTGRLLAPVNIQQDYWLKQEYRVYDATGTTLWKASVIDSWDVQFQPDVTQDSCQGIWCSPFNGFQKLSNK